MLIGYVNRSFNVRPRNLTVEEKEVGTRMLINKIFFLLKNVEFLSYYYQH